VKAKGDGPNLPRREQRIVKETALQWATDQVSMRSRASASEQDTPRMSMTTQIWESWIKNQIQTSQNAATDAVMTAVADVMAAELKTYQKAVDEIAVLRSELTALKAEVAELLGQVRVRSAIDGVESRLAKLEAPLSRLRAAG
jgi:hypothetical protein